MENDKTHGDEIDLLMLGIKKASPRTEAELERLWGRGLPAAYVGVEFAKTLEEELNSAKKEIESLRKFIPDYIVPRVI
jgi:hypothetical protein